MTTRWPWQMLAACVASVLLACRDPAPLDTARPARGFGRAPEVMPVAIRPVPARELCVTSGGLHLTSDERWLSTRPTLRATAAHSAGYHAMVEFRYLGGTADSAADVSRQQLGLELLSRDACNVMYAIWRVDKPGFVVASVKANADFSRDSQCAERGARNLRPFWKTVVEPPAVGSVHELSAILERGLLEVRIDQQPVLRAVTAGCDVPTLGTSGLRGDNVRFELIRFEADVPETRPASSTRCDPRAHSGQWLWRHTLERKPSRMH